MVFKLLTNVMGARESKKIGDALSLDAAIDLAKIFISKPVMNIRIKRRMTNNSDKVTIILVDNHKLLREAWSVILNIDARLLVVGETGNAEEAYSIIKEKAPRISLVDIIMSPVDGFEITRKIIEFSAATKVIGLSVHTSVGYAKKMMELGAKGYVTKNSCRDELIAAIIEISIRNKFVCQEIKDILAAEQLEGEVVQTCTLNLQKQNWKLLMLMQKSKTCKILICRLLYFYLRKKLSNMTECLHKWPISLLI